MIHMHPLTERVIAVRRMLEAMEAEPRKTIARRADIVQQGKYLEGLEVAATLALPSDQLQILLDDTRAKDRAAYVAESNDRLRRMIDTQIRRH